MNGRIVVVRRWQIAVLIVGICVIAGLTRLWDKDLAASADAMPAGERVIHMVTGEYSAVTPDGREIEAYRWDPGTIFVNKGENVQLRIYGVNGDSHPFVIEGLGVEGIVKKGEETIVNFHASKAGIYRIICYTHPDIANNGPMIGYIIVD
jgi:plastocyanin